jgi:hypothetical protein
MSRFMGASKVEIRESLILVFAIFVKQADFLFQLPADLSVKLQDQNHDVIHRHIRIKNRVDWCMQSNHIVI